MACECLTQMDERLARHNSRIQTQFSFSGDNLSEIICTPYIGTEKIDRSRRKKAVGVIATFCPFCGARYRSNVEEA